MTIPLLITILIAIESGGDPTAIGDNGKAHGVLQIHKVMVRECNRIAGYDKWTYADRMNPAKSIEMCSVFHAHQKRKHPGATDQRLLESWNSGSIRRPATKSYKKKVALYLEEN